MPISEITQEYSSWLVLWSEHIKSNPNTTHLPLAACKVTTPLKPDAWHLMLATHPEQSLIKFFIEGMDHGKVSNWLQLSIHFTTTSQKEHGECKLTSGHSDYYLQTKLNQNRVAGPFNTTILSEGDMSRFGVIPKNHQSDQWRLIVDLSYPKDHSVNDGIPGSLCSLKYVYYNQ